MQDTDITGGSLETCDASRQNAEIEGAPGVIAPDWSDCHKDKRSANIPSAAEDMPERC